MFRTAASRLTARSIRGNVSRASSSVAFRASAVKGTTHLMGLTFAAAAASTVYVASNNVAACDALPVQGVPGTKQERTFLAVKPDGVQRGLIGDIIARFEKRGYKLVGLKMVWPTLKMAEDHYADLSKKPFYGGLTKFFSSGPVVCMCWEGTDIIAQGRQMLGETQPLSSKPGSIRGDFSIDLGRNICHGSDSPESAQHELEMWFPEGVNDWSKSVDSSVYER
uniref:Nucleoside diphosphate kinase n=1 Tax=Attheya septentrionalis TaxID=420275 RepID=A0A7S2XPE2_9STRA|mmetsp:Transcript_24380/g.44094  ORF Transcript_24380/g.44094 Transcript_24380/m.44094 type:complete len:223 (+) Transcript_24380:29-697(+)